GVAQPVWANSVGHPSLFRRPSHDYADAPSVQQLPAPGGENRLLRARISPEGHQFRPQRRGQPDGPRAAVLAEHSNLAGVPSRPQIAPKQPTSLGNPQSSGIKQPQQDPI